MNPGEKLLFDALVRGFANMAEIGALGLVLKAGLPLSKEQLAEQGRNRMRLITASPTLASWAGIPRGGMTSEAIEQIVEKGVAETTQRAENAVKATELVFYHALCDETANDCVRALTLLRPDECAKSVRDEKVTLGAVRVSDYTTLLGIALAKFATKFANQSLPSRTAWILARCRRSTRWEDLPEYEFNNARLDRLDKLRHSIVHREGVRRGVEVGAGDLEYLLHTALFLPSHVMSALDLVDADGYVARALNLAK